MVAAEAEEGAQVVVRDLEFPLVVDRGERPPFDLAHNGVVYQYVNRGCPIKGHGAVLPQLVRPFLDEGKRILIVEHGGYYLVFASE